MSDLPKARGIDITDAFSEMCWQELRDARTKQAMGSQPVTPGVVALGLSFETTLAYTMTSETKQINMPVPPCLVGTVVGTQLASRMLLDT